MISMIVAMSQNRVIGKDNKMPWSIPEDLQYFRKVTSGHVVIMGRKTYESIGIPLPHRTNIVLTRDQSYQADGCIVMHEMDALLAQYQTSEEEVFIIGGSTLYQVFMPFANKLYITQIQATIEGDTAFPILPITVQGEGVFKCISSESQKENHEYRYCFTEWIKQI